MFASEPRRISRTVLFGLFTAFTVLGAPPLTTIQDMVYRADGARFNGLVVIQWKSFDAADSTVVGSQGTTVRVTNGFLQVKLVPTVNAAIPASYQVTYNSDGKYQYQETWAVPASSTPLRIRDVRVNTGNTVLPPSGPAQITDITGLTEALDARPVKGPGYTNSRVAWLNSTGQVEGVVGDPADCVKADGTTGPCGTGGTLAGTITYVDGEVPVGAVDGVNATYTLTAAPVPPSSLSVYRNGILQNPSRDFLLVNNTLTFTAASTPQAGDSLVLHYRITQSGASGPNFADAETPAGTLDGANTSFTLANAPSPASSLHLYRNGLMLKSGLDYSLNGTTVQFVTGAVPQAGDSLLAYYRH